MTDIRELFERQAAWQSGRRNLSWPEKIRMAEAMRETAIRFRAMRRADAARPTRGKPVEAPKRPGG